MTEVKKFLTTQTLKSRREMVEVLGTAPRSITFIANYIYHHSSSNLTAQGRGAI